MSVLEQMQHSPEFFLSQNSSTKVAELMSGLTPLV